ncbi:hypothetical protein AB0M43_03950 [Longispora sp. NPDC051575]|uniref:hypothetical protein n=1 Tax=Longispora sp. NPDC051575 TaxID=3154943 RepID=UPI0034254EB4
MSTRRRRLALVLLALLAGLAIAGAGGGGGSVTSFDEPPAWPWCGGCITSD